MSRLRADLDTFVGTAAGSYVLPNTRAVTDNFVLEYDNSGYVTIPWDEYRVAARTGYLVKRSLDEDGNDVDWSALTGYLWYWTGTIVTPDAGRFTVTREPLLWYDEQQPTPPIDNENAINLELAYDAIVDTLIAAGGAFQVDERGFAFGDPPPTYDESAGTYTGTGVLGHTPGIVGVLADVLQFKLDETGLELLDDAKLGINIAISDMDANTRVHIYETGDSNDAAILIEDVSDTQHGGLKLYRARASLAATQANDVLGSIIGKGHTGSAYSSEPMTFIKFVAAENTSATNQGSYILFETTLNTTTGAAGRREVVRIDNAGYLHVGAASDADAPLHVEGTNNPLLKLEQTGASGATVGASVLLFQDDGAAVASGDRLGRFQFGGAQDASHTAGTGSYIGGFAAETWSSGNNGQYIGVFVVAKTTASQVEQVRFPEDGGLALKDGITAPATLSGFAKIYVDGTSGDLRVLFGDGTDKLIVTDT